MNRTKAVHVLSSLELGGAEILTIDLAKNKERNFDMEVVCFSRGSLQDEFQKSGVKTIQIKKGVFYLSFVLNLLIYLKRNNPDIIHLHSVVNPIPVLIASYFTRAKVLLNIHGYSLSRRKIKNLIFKGVSKIAFVSETLMKAYYKKADKKALKKFVLFYNGIDPSKFSNPPKGDVQNDNKIPLMGMIGNFNTVRDQLTVCKALKKLSQKQLSFKFLFVGGNHIPQLFDECHQFCKDNIISDKVEFVGSRTDVPAILSKLDYFVYASHHDTFGIAVVEAMMSGTPVIVNDLEVFKEITDNGKFARLYETGNAEDLAAAIKEMLQNPDKSKLLANNAQKHAIEKFSITTHINNLESIYQEMLN